jgi:hypothetical protein
MDMNELLIRTERERTRQLMVDGLTKVLPERGVDISSRSASVEELVAMGQEPQEIPFHLDTEGIPSLCYGAPQATSQGSRLWGSRHNGNDGPQDVFIGLPLHGARRPAHERFVSHGENGAK